MNERLTYILVESAASKWIKGLRSDTARTARRLVEYGETLAKSEEQKQLFRKAEKLLGNEKSGYLSVIKNVVCSVSPDRLKAFGLNIGFNILSRKPSGSLPAEKNPLLLLIELDETSGMNSKIKKTVDEGRALGIYAYCIFDRSKEDLSQLLTSVMGQHDDCDFLLFTENPALLLKSKALLSLRNAVLIIPASDAAASKTSIMENELLWGCYAEYTSACDPTIMNSAKLARDFEAPFLFLVPTHSCPADDILAVRTSIDQSRSGDCDGLFVSELIGDIESISEKMHTRPVFATILPCGDVISGCGGEVLGNAFQLPLSKILGK